MFAQYPAELSYGRGFILLRDRFCLIYYQAYVFGAAERGCRSCGRLGLCETQRKLMLDAATLPKHVVAHRDLLSIHGIDEGHQAHSQIFGVIPNDQDRFTNSRKKKKQTILLEHFG